MEQVYKYTNYEKVKVTNNSGVFQTIIKRKVIYYHLERGNYKVLKFHVN